MHSPSNGTTENISVRRKTSFAGDVMRLTSGTVFAQALLVLASPFLTRLYSPESFGIYALFTSITSVIGIISCLRYELAIMLPKSDKEAANLLGVSLLFAATVSIITIPLVWWGRGTLLKWLNAPQMAPYLWLIPPAILLGGVYLALNYWNSRTKHFTMLSIARVTASTTTVSAQLGAGYAGFSSGGSLIWGHIFGKIASTVVLSRQIWRDDRRILLGSISFKSMYAGIRRYQKFPKIDIWGALLNNISWQLPVILLAVFFSQTIVGFYALAFRLIKMPMALIGQAIGQVFFQRTAEARYKQGELAKTVETVFEKLVALSLFPAILIGILGRELFVVIFGASWAEAGVYAQILSIWLFFWFISSPLSSVFVTLEKQKAAFFVHTLIFSGRLVSIFIGGIFDNIYLTLGLFALTGIISYGGLTFWNLSLAGVSSKLGIKICLKYFIWSIPIVVLLFLCKFLVSNPIWTAVGAFFAIAVYYSALLCMNPGIYSYFILGRDYDRITN